MKDRDVVIAGILLLLLWRSKTAAQSDVTVGIETNPVDVSPQQWPPVVPYQGNGGGGGFQNVSDFDQAFGRAAGYPGYDESYFFT